MMINKSFQIISFRELVLTIIIALLLGVIPILIDSYLLINHVAAFITSMFLLALGANILIRMTRRFFATVLFYLFFAVITMNILDTGALGWEKILAYGLSGLVLELIYRILKIKIDFLSLDLILGTSLALFFLPLCTAFIISTALASTFPLSLINLMILSFAVGLAASILFSLLWSLLEKSKKIIRFQIHLK